MGQKVISKAQQQCVAALLLQPFNVIWMGKFRHPKRRVSVGPPSLPQHVEQEEAILMASSLLLPLKWSCCLTVGLHQLILF